MNVIKYALEQLNTIILGKSNTLRLALSCILARGHLLLEDVPGVGKTTLAHSLASVLGLDAQRIQFTNDMLPSDILGVSIFHPENGQFKFSAGPIFHRFLLADEINRASPKVQSALLEAMEEGQVSIDGKTFALPKPFVVVATQNPIEQMGTFPLPESQLDRFLMRISLGYPDEQFEQFLYINGGRRAHINNLKPAFNAESLMTLQKIISQITISEALANYVYRLVSATRREGLFVQGLSPRAGLAVTQAARAWAVLCHRNYVIPEDVQAVWIAVAAHRLKSLRQGMHSESILLDLMKNVPVA